MDNKIDATENIEEVMDSDTTQKDDGFEKESETELFDDESGSEENMDSENLSQGSLDDTIVIPKTTIDEETVEQLVENRSPVKNESGKRRKKKKKHYGLKTLIIILAFVLVFMISFFTARTLFTLDDKKIAEESQKATDITEKMSEESDKEDKVIIAQQSDIAEEDGDHATPIQEDKDIDEPSSSSKSNSNKVTDKKVTNNKVSNNKVTNDKVTDNKDSVSNKTSDKGNSPSNNSNNSDDGDDGGIILPGKPSSDEEPESSKGSAGIELE